MKNVLSACVLMICAGIVPVTNSQTANKPTTNDVKIRQRMTMGGAGSESLLYIKGQRMRTEMPGSMGFTSIMQCDLKRTVTINEKTKTYLIASTDGARGLGTAEGDGGGAPPTPRAQQPPAKPRGGVVNITNTITDTGERKEMFGFTARRIKTSLVKTASPEACDKDQKIETDGWYIDFQYAFECATQTQKHQPYVRPSADGCKDEIRSKNVGTAKLGFPLLVTTTIYQPDGRTSTMTQEVLELSREPLAASLFEIPEGYTLAKDTNELYGISAAGITSGTYNPQPKSNATATTANTTNVADRSRPKKPGVIRIGILLPSVQLTSGDTAHAAESLRRSFAGFLSGPTIEVVSLSARSPAQALDEARQSQCDYILSASMNVKKGGGSMFGKAIGNIAGAAVGHIPGSGPTSSIKAKDELSLEYKLDAVETTKTVLSNTAKAKARSDGEDILTPLVEASAKTILVTVRK